MTILISRGEGERVERERDRGRGYSSRLSAAGRWSEIRCGSLESFAAFASNQPHSLTDRYQAIRILKSLGMNTFRLGHMRVLR